MTQTDNYRSELEQKIFNYFLEDYSNFIGKSSFSSFKESFDAWKESDTFTNPLMRNYVAQDLFEKEFNISLHDMMSAFKENKTSYKEYISNIMLTPEFKMEEKVLNEGLLDVLLNEEPSDNGSMQVDPNDTEKVKQNALEQIKKDLEDKLENLTPEEEEALLAQKISGALNGDEPINEKVEKIKQVLSDKDSSIIAEAISKYTGMHLSEAKSVLEDY